MPAIRFTKVALAVVLALVVAPAQSATKAKSTHRLRHAKHTRKWTARKHRAPARKPIQAKLPNTSKPAACATETVADPSPVMSPPPAMASGYVCPGMVGPAASGYASETEAPPQPCLMTIGICRKSGLLPGPQCETYGGPVEEQIFTVGDQPEERCEVCAPPPAPAPDPAKRPDEPGGTKLLEEVTPDVPAELAEAHGTVTVRYWVDEQGRVVDPAVACSSGSMALDDCALRAVLRFRYASAEKAGACRIPAEKTFRF